MPDIDFEKLLEIDEDNLTYELASTHQFLYSISQYTIAAEKLHNDAILELQVYEVKLAKKLKEEHEEKNKNSKFKPEKLTETEIERSYRADEEWLRLKRITFDKHEEWQKLIRFESAMKKKHLSCMAINKRQLKSEENY